MSVYALALAVLAMAPPTLAAAKTWQDHGDVAAPQEPDPPAPAVAAPGSDGTTVPAATGKVDRCLASTCRQVPTRETLSAIGVGTAYARAIVGGFEQGAGLGGGVQVTSAAAIPVVELRASALVSIRRYRRFDLEAYLPRIGGSRNHADVWASYLHRDIDFFGAGGYSSQLTTQFTIVQRSYQGSVYRDLAAHAQGGVYAQVMQTASSRAGDAGDRQVGQFPSTPDQSPARWIAGAVSNTRILSYGGFLSHDTRDNSDGLTRGIDLYGRVAAADGVGSHEGSAGYGWVEGEFDVRRYAPLGSPRTALLLRSRGAFATPRGGRQIPFYDLPSLGGRSNLRGYSSYRFRGNQVLLFSTELQRTVYAISGVRGVDAFGSADAGGAWRALSVSAESKGPVGEDIETTRWYSALGGGIQYRHSRSVAVRVETGHSREGSLMYVSMSRGF